MTPSHDWLDDDAREWASLYALEALPSDEAADYARHLEGCAACRAEVESLTAVLGAMGSALGIDAVPSPSLRSRVLESARSVTGPHAIESGDLQPWKQWAASLPAGLTLVRAGDGGFEPTAVPGIRARRLFVDAERNRVTMLVRMAPGTAYPAHRHGGAEECYVLEGDLLTGDTRMRAGDYQRAEGTSVHGVQSTEGGCLLLLVSALNDELLPRSASRSAPAAP